MGGDSRPQNVYIRQRRRAIEALEARAPPDIIATETPF
jgi:hypothetical protein